MVSRLMITIIVIIIVSYIFAIIMLFLRLFVWYHYCYFETIRFARSQALEISRKALSSLSMPPTWCESRAALKARARRLDSGMRASPASREKPLTVDLENPELN